ncbi:hypothetical protein [uncultured Williamsia sp.]|uniref:hypothetical protein n=1 Tax=uncultured Williamsia sp. TaxID=259311 RepID=UPI002601AC4C|nr:hypothetical protein [uncultured Williamsia sp.]
MRVERLVASLGSAAIVATASACTTAGDAGAPNAASESLCQGLPSAEVVKLFDLQPGSGGQPGDAQVRSEVDTSMSGTAPGCRWSTGENTLGINVVQVAGGRDRLASISTGPVDVGDGVELFPPRQTDAMCQAEFTARTGPTDQAITVIVLPDLQLTRPSSPSVDWCQRTAPAAKTVMRGLGWLR